MKDIARNFKYSGTMTVSGVVLKCYGIWTNNGVIEAEEFRWLEEFIADPELKVPMLKAAPGGFVILHRGTSMDYLVISYWGNENENFINVFVCDEFGAHAWHKDEQYSCCVWDLEVIDLERRLFISTVLTAECRADGLSRYLNEHVAPSDDGLLMLV